MSIYIYVCLVYLVIKSYKLLLVVVSIRLCLSGFRIVTNMMSIYITYLKKSCVYLLVIKIVRCLFTLH
jgi:hypothetical protein